MIKTIRLEQILMKQDRYLDSAFGTPAGDHVVLLEVAETPSFDRLHFRNATHMTLEEVHRIAAQRFPDKGVEIILYGARDQMASIWSAALSLERQGYPNLFVYEPREEDKQEGPKGEWIHEGLWRQSSLVPADHHDTTIPADASRDRADTNSQEQDAKDGKVDRAA